MPVEMSADYAKCLQGVMRRGCAPEPDERYLPCWSVARRVGFAQLALRAGRNSDLRCINHRYEVLRNS
jgi:hypothetical protein